MNSLLAGVVSLALSGLIPSLAHASMVQFRANQASSTSHLGNFTGTLTYTSTTAMTGTLSVVINNTNSTSEGGYITGMVFDIPGIDVHATASLATASPNGFQNTGVASAAPFGTFEAGAALGGNWLGGGSPNGGIAPGYSGILTFAVNASDAAGLTAAAFLGSDPTDFVVRFRGFNNGGSDKVLGMAVPSPGATGLGAIACLILSARRRRS